MRKLDSFSDFDYDIPIPRTPGSKLQAFASGVRNRDIHLKPHV